MCWHTTGRKKRHQSKKISVSKLWTYFSTKSSEPINAKISLWVASMMSYPTVEKEQIVRVRYIFFRFFVSKNSDFVAVFALAITYGP